MVTGHRYLGGFLGDAAAEREWLEKKVQGWTELVAILAGVALKHPQCAYAGLQNSLQQEWAFVQRVTPGVGAAFGPVEEALWEVFVPALFRGLTEGLLDRAKCCTNSRGHPLQKSPLLLEGLLQSCIGRLRVLEVDPCQYGNRLLPSVNFLSQPLPLRRLVAQKASQIPMPRHYQYDEPTEMFLGPGLLPGDTLA